MKNFINIHVLQSVAPSNINRDESGRPKTSTYGGTLRHRVSSQSWKRAMRMYFKDNAIETAYRTKNIADLLAHKIVEKDSTIVFDEAKALSIVGLKAIKWINKSKKDDQTDALTMVSPAQIDLMAEIIIQNQTQPKDLVKELKNAVQYGDNAIDLALFGRMVASDPNLNVEGSTLVSHAISTHGIEEEFDFYTATDDFLDIDDSGAGMLGDLEFTSSTLYRFASLNIPAFIKNLGEVDQNTIDSSIKDFVRSFIYSMPSGKQNSFATPTLPGLIVVTFSDFALSYVTAFENPIKFNTDGYFKESTSTLLNHIIDFDNTYNIHEERFAVLVDKDEDLIEKLSLVTANTGNIDQLLNNFSSLRIEVTDNNNLSAEDTLDSDME